MGRYERNNAMKRKKREKLRKKKIMEVDRSISFGKNGLRSEKKKNLSSVMTGKNSALIERELEQVYDHIGAKKNSVIEIDGEKIMSKFITIDLNAGLNLGFMPTRAIFREGYVPCDKYCHGNTKGVKVYSYDDLDTVRGKANVVLSDPPYGIKSGGHTLWNVNDYLKNKSFINMDNRFGVNISMKVAEVQHSYDLAFQRACQLLDVGGYFFVKCQQAPSQKFHASGFVAYLAAEYDFEYVGTRVLVTPTKNSNQKKPKIQNNMSLLEIFQKSKNTKNNTITKSIKKSKKWFYENGGHKENEDLKNEIKHLKGQMKKVILENEKLKTAANNEITIVRNVDTEKDETISLKRKATSENNNSTSWLSLTSMWIACRSKKLNIMKWFYENGGHKENEDLKNEIKHLKGQMKKVILENEKLKTAANNEITIVRNVDTEKDETISLKRKATSENNNSTSWLSLTSANNQKFKKVKTEFQDKVADLDEKVEDLDENYNYQIRFTNNKLTEIDELKEQIKQLNKEKAVQEKLTSELLKKVKRLGGRE